MVLIQQMKKAYRRSQMTGALKSNNSRFDLKNSAHNPFSYNIEPN